MAKAKGPRPSEFLTTASFRNAQVVLQAIGGSTNGLIHLTAIANRTGIASTSKFSTSSAARCRS